MKEKHLKQRPLYLFCFIFAAFEVLCLLGWIVFLRIAEPTAINFIIFLFIPLLVLFSFYLHSFWKLKLRGVKFFLILHVVIFCGVATLAFVTGFKPLFAFISGLFVIFILMRAYYNLLKVMPDEHLDDPHN